MSSVDGTWALDADGNPVRDHPLLKRPLDGETEFHTQPRLIRVDVAGLVVDALEEHWSDDGLRGHTLVYLERDVAGKTDAELAASTAGHFGVERSAPKDAPAAGDVSVNRRRGEFALATAAFYAEYVD